MDFSGGAGYSGMLTAKDAPNIVVDSSDEDGKCLINTHHEPDRSGPGGDGVALPAEFSQIPNVIQC